MEAQRGGAAESGEAVVRRKAYDVAGKGAEERHLRNHNKLFAGGLSITKIERGMKLIYRVGKQKSFTRNFKREGLVTISQRKTERGTTGPKLLGGGGRDRTDKRKPSRKISTKRFQCSLEGPAKTRRLRQTSKRGERNLLHGKSAIFGWMGAAV